MKKIAILLVLLGVGNHYKTEITNFFKSGSFDSYGDPQILLFSQKECGQPCEMAVRNLNQRGLDYQLLDPNIDTNEWKKFGAPGRLPFMVVGYDRVYRYNPGEISSALALNYGDEVLTSTEQRIYQEHFDDYGNPRIVLYGTTWCGYCNKLRKDFRENGVEFLDYDVEKPVKKKWLLKAMGIEGYPTVYIGYKKVMGSDYRAVMAAL